MKYFLKLTVLVLVTTGTLMSTPLLGQCTQLDEMCLVGVQGYDVVSYQNGKPLKGTGHHVAMHDGVIYIFANASNMKAFEKDPMRYLPAYGGFCAFGVAVDKKLVGDPMFWTVVDGRLYLNLDKKVQQMWKKDMAENIKKADEKWPDVKTMSIS